MSGKIAKRASWSGKWAFILASAASAIGLGNLWRFPYLAAKYGGGVFLLTYVVLVVTFGFALMVLEVALGRKTGQSAIGAFKSFGKKYAFIGIFTSAIPFIIVPYYCVIGGWVLKYASAYITDGSAALADGGTYFSSFIGGGTESFLFMGLFLVLVLGIVALGVKNGIEKANKVLMPVLIVMTVGIAVYELTLPGAIDGVLYYITPDFSKFSVQLVVAALGQMFYSLSLAMGIMVTYGSYMRKQDNLEQSVRRIEIFDSGYAFLAGLMIVPAAFVAMGSAEAVASKSGPSLMFIILPEIFQQMGSIATVMGVLFFLLVVFAALTSAISLTETCVSIVHDATRWTRRKAFIVAAAFIAVVAVFVNMGYSQLAIIQPLGPGSTILDFMDFISNSVMMPIAALMACVFVGWVVKPKVVIDEVKSSGKFVGEKLFTVMVKFIAPVLLVVILVAYTASQFGLFSM
jgi:neurotransmitter:Na+ symporter, NSS family